MTAFTLEAPRPRQRRARRGDTVAYFTIVGGRRRGRWVRAQVLRAANQDGAILCRDDDGDLVMLTSWESCRRRAEAAREAA